MAQPERQVSAEEKHAVNRGASGSAPLAAPGKPLKKSASWEDVFLAASPSQQAQLLALAERQGLLYGHQLPHLTNGQPRDQVQRFLKRVFTGSTHDLTPVRAEHLPAADLDEHQCDAVARALATPDIFLIQGLPATGKSRVAAEIVSRSADRGERVLLVSPRAASVDRVLELTRDSASVSAVRCLGHEENLDAIPEYSRSLVFSEQLARLQNQTQLAAELRLKEAQGRHASLTADASAWPLLLELADRSERLLAQSRELGRRRETVPDAVATLVARLQLSSSRESCEFPAPEHGFERDIQASAQGQREGQIRIEQLLADLNLQLQSSRDHLARLTHEENKLAPLAEAKAGGRWWRLAWWRATYRGDVAALAADLQARTRLGKEELARLEREAVRLHSERRQLEENARADLAALIQRETERRLGEIDAEEAELESERSAVESKRQGLFDRLHSDTPHLASTVADVRASMAQWQELLEAASRTCDSSRQWADGLRHNPRMLADRLSPCFNVVAASLTGAATHLTGGETNEQLTFDLLLVEHAESLTESEFVALARRCRRWVLIAEAVSSKCGPPSHERSSSKHRSERSSAKPTAVPFFQRLWATLHCDPSRLPYVWAQEPDNRLCCRLRAISSEQRRWLELERVADYHDIELRIVAPPRGKSSGTDSFLAEVVFPPAMSLTDAKAYIFRELEEAPVRASATSLHWQESPDCLRLRLTEQPAIPNCLISVQLSEGVKELIAQSANDEQTGLDWYTDSLEFQRSAGWDRDRAGAWTERHLYLLDLGRTAELKAPQGFHPELAAFISDVLYEDASRRPISSENALNEPAVEFVAIPSLPRGSRRQGHNNRLPNGAGLEADLADARHRDRLPAELRERIEAKRGFANLVEAQAIIRALARLARERSNGKTIGWCGSGDARSRNGASLHPIRVGVVALYQGQAQLIRLLLEPGAAALHAAGVDVHVDVPAGFDEQECAIGMISLTRSHTHRAASLGDGPPALATALTRGRCRLIFFGDVGTLARRVEWQSRLDHLDEAASKQELGMVSRLLRYIQGEGRYQRGFHLRHDNALAGAAIPRNIQARRPVGREGSNA